MSQDELERVLATLRNRMTFSDTVFVLVLEREADGEMKLLEYGLREIGDLASWIAVHKQRQERKQTMEKGV